MGVLQNNIATFKAIQTRKSPINRFKVTSITPLSRIPIPKDL